MRTLKILSVVCIAGILWLSFFSWYSCDDFCNINELSRYSVVKMAWFQYLNWDGRSLSVAAFVQLFALKYFPAELTVLLWALSFVCTVFLVFKIISIENPSFLWSSHSVVGVAILSAVMWLGMWKLIPDIIYWPTGGSYSLLNLLGIGWLFVFLAGLKARRFGAGSCVFIFSLSLICGVNSHNFIVALIFLCLAELVQHRFVNKNRNASVYITCSLAGLLIGAGVVFFSPGNDVRLHVISYHGFNSKFLYFYFIVLAKYSYWLLSLFALCFFVAWSSGKKFFFQQKKMDVRIKEVLNALGKIQSAFSLFYRHKYLLAALSTILVFMATSFFAVPRTAIFFVSFFVIWFFQQGWKPGWKIDSKRFIYSNTVLLGFFFCVIFFQHFKAHSVKHQLAERVKIFESKKGMDVVVAPVPGSTVPFAFTFTDISSDSGYWVNRCVALHYGLKTVRTGN